MEFVKLNNGITMPQLGLGTFQSNDPKQCKQTILDALEMGYRLIDTAQGYGNEAAIGNALAKTNVPREELFITTKVAFRAFDDARTSVENSLRFMRLDYLDLVLMHWPFGNYYAAWRELEKKYQPPISSAA